MMIAGIFFLALTFIQAPQTAPQVQPKLGSIDGYVLRAGTNEPVYRAQITLIRADPPAVLNPMPQMPKTAATDKSGHFTLTNVEAGRYNLRAQRNGYVQASYGQKSPTGVGTALVLGPGQAMKDVIFRVTPAGLVTGRIYDSEGEPLIAAEVSLVKSVYDYNGQKNLQALHTVYTNDLGEYRLYWVTPGKYYVRANYSGRSFFPGSRNPNSSFYPGDEVYAATFYPGTTDPGGAGTIDVLPGAHISAIDLTLAKSKAFTIRGRVVMTNPVTMRGRPFVSIRPKQPTGGMIFSTGGNTANPDGTFELRNVPPGAYVVMANSNDGPTQFRGQAPVDVAETDVEGVVILLSSGYSIPGRIYIDGQSTQPLGANSPLENVRPLIMPLGDSTSGIMLAGPPAAIKPDGTFTMSQVLPGNYRLDLSGLPTDYFLKAARLGNTDVLQEGLMLERQPEGSLDILVSPNAGRIDGSVLDNEKKPVRSTQVVLIPQQRDRSERYRTASTDQNGQFNIRGIVPGDYKLFAWEEIESGAFRDPDFIRQFEQLGKAVRISEGAHENVEVKIIPAANQP